jgi:hypothetical protein
MHTLDHETVQNTLSKFSDIIEDDGATFTPKDDIQIFLEHQKLIWDALNKISKSTILENNKFLFINDNNGCEIKVHSFTSNAVRNIAVLSAIELKYCNLNRFMSTTIEALTNALIKVGYEVSEVTEVPTSTLLSNPDLYFGYLVYKGNSGNY